MEKTSLAMERWIWISLPMLFMVGSVFHFLYDLSGESPIIGAFAAVNESVWEHQKMVLLPVAAWWLARPGAADPTYRRRLLIAAALWSVPLLVVPPVLSADAVLYADLGWIVNQSQNPYVVGLTGAGGPYAPHVDPLWAGNGVAYPPLALLTDAVVVRRT